MHAILLISATHLNYLEPTNKIHQKASIVHLGKTLKLFRAALSKPINAQTADAYMATTVLLYHYAWSNVDFMQSPPVAEGSVQGLDLSTDPLFTLSKGVRDVFISSMNYLYSDESIFTSSCQYRPVKRIVNAARNSTKVPAEFEAFLERYFRRIQDPIRHALSKLLPCVVHSELIHAASLTCPHCRRSQGY